MTQSRGYAILMSPTVTKEWDTITCAHCNAIVIMKKDPGGWCRRCMKGICGPCADLGKCTPFERQLEAMEARGRMLAAIGV